MTKGKLQRPWHTGLLLNQMSVDWTKFMLRQTNLADEFHQAIARLNAKGLVIPNLSSPEQADYSALARGFASDLAIELSFSSAASSSSNVWVNTLTASSWPISSAQAIRVP